MRMLLFNCLIIVIGFSDCYGRVPTQIRNRQVETKYLPEALVAPKIDETNMKFTFYVWENAHSFLMEKEKPRFVERGPYVYRVVREKKEHEAGEDFLEYSQLRYFSFLPELSCQGCSDEDTVSILNMPLIGAVDGVMKESPFLQGVALLTLAAAIENTENSGDIVLTDTVHNILFGGVNTDLVNLLVNNLLFNGKLPPAIQDNGFAIFNNKNGSSINDNYRILTQPEERKSEIELWGKTIDQLVPDLSTTKTCPSTINGHEHDCARSDPTWWPHPDGEGEIAGSSCNAIRGTTGEEFPPLVGDRVDEDLWVFTNDICRSIYYRYSEDEDVDGIPVLRFTVPEDSTKVNKKRNICMCKEFDPREVPSNEGCLRQLENSEDEYDISDCEITSCYDGLQNVENCQKSPVVMSAPHFYMAEDQLQNFDSSFAVPNKERDESYLDIEPFTGEVLRAAKRLQVNMPIVPTGRSEIPFLEAIQHVPAFPVLWFEEGY